VVVRVRVRVRVRVQMGNVRAYMRVDVVCVDPFPCKWVKFDQRPD